MCTYNSDDATTTTGSLTQLSSLESNCINNGDTTTTASRHAVRHAVCNEVRHDVVLRQAPPDITTTNIENSVGLIDDVISPLEMQSGTPSKFDFGYFYR